MTEEDDRMFQTEVIGTPQALTRIRGELLVAVARDASPKWRRRKAGLVAVVAVVAVGAATSAIAAVSGAFSSAPPEVKQTFADLGAAGSNAIEIGTIDEHAAYAAPTANGGFCLYFAPNPRSGPSGPDCTASDPKPGEIALNLSLGNDGGFVFGRVGSENAVRVDIDVPGQTTLSATVRDERFFLVQLPASSMPELWEVNSVVATARDAKGTPVARSEASFAPTDVPTQTTEGLGTSIRPE
jgi:hypothetical protein